MNAPAVPIRTASSRWSTPPRRRPWLCAGQRPYLLHHRQRVEHAPALDEAALRRLLKHGKIVLHPRPDGLFIAKCEVFPLAVVLETRKPPGSPGLSVPW